MTNIISHVEFANLVNKQGGASRNFYDMTPPQSPGVMVSQAGSEEKSPLPLSDYEAKSYLKRHEVQATGRDYHGGWSYDGHAYQDISRKYGTIGEARTAGEREKQIAGYVLPNTDPNRPEAHEIFFDRRLPGVESDPEWRGTSISSGRGERLNPEPSDEDRESLANVNRGATLGGKPVTLNEVMGTISEGRRKRRGA